MVQIRKLCGCWENKNLNQSPALDCLSLRAGEVYGRAARLTPLGRKPVLLPDNLNKRTIADRGLEPGSRFMGKSLSTQCSVHLICAITLRLYFTKDYRQLTDM